MHAHRRRRENTTEIIVVSRGSAEDNRQKAELYGFEFPVVLQDRWKLSKKYGIFATPVAFLIDENGCTARNVAVGFDQIHAILLEEFRRGPVDGFVEAAGDISRVLSSSMSRRDALRVSGRIAAVAIFAAIGLERTALAACSAGFTACGTACCNNTNERCCNPAASRCCPTSVFCCAGKCCAPTEVCFYGVCKQTQQDP
jgi:hypothetical protein